MANDVQTSFTEWNLQIKPRKSQIDEDFTENGQRQVVATEWCQGNDVHMLWNGDQNAITFDLHITFPRNLVWTSLIGRTSSPNIKSIVIGALRPVASKWPTNWGWLTNQSLIESLWVKTLCFKVWLSIGSYRHFFDIFATAQNIVQVKLKFEPDIWQTVDNTRRTYFSPFIFNAAGEGSFKH